MKNDNNIFPQQEDLNESIRIKSSPLGSIIPGSTFLSYGGRTLEFDSIVTQSLSLPDFRARCHSISYETLCDAIITPINRCLNYEGDTITLKGYLDGLQKAVFPYGKDKLEEKHKSFYVGATNAIAKIINNPGNVKTLSVQANDLLNNLNNSIQNLREGSGFWNSSVQSAFDPVSWCYVRNNEVISTQDNLNIVPGQPTANFFPADVPTEVKNGFYLTDLADGYRLCTIINETCGSGKFYTLQAQSRSKEPFMFSSSNKFEFIPSSRYIELDAKVFYLNKNSWVEFES